MNLETNFFPVSKCFGKKFQEMNLASIFQQCHACKGEIDAGDMAVFAPKAGENLCWHPACFICSHCEDLLVDLVYCFKDNSLYCERHYAELVRPRCAACDEVRDSLYVLFSLNARSQLRSNIDAKFLLLYDPRIETTNFLFCCVFRNHMYDPRIGTTNFLFCCC